MKFKEIMQNRYTTKVYDVQKRVDSSIVDELKEILRLSPSSINSQPWRFVFVEGDEMKSKFAEASFFNREKIEQASLLVVFQRYDNVEAFEEWMQDNMLEGQINYYKSFIKTKSREYILDWFSRQVYLALGVFLSGCASLEVDSTPMEGIDCEGYDTILGASEYKTLFAVVVGYRSSEDWNLLEKSPKRRKDISEVIVENC